MTLSDIGRGFSGKERYNDTEHSLHKKIRDRRNIVGLFLYLRIYSRLKYLNPETSHQLSQDEGLLLFLCCLRTAFAEQNKTEAAEDQVDSKKYTYHRRSGKDVFPHHHRQNNSQKA